MKVPADRRYAETHEWFLLDDNVVTLGITQYAADELTDITYVELPEVGAKLKQGQSFGTIESVKAVSELYSPVSGEVAEVNTALKDKPEAINGDPHANWMILVKLSNPAEVDALLDATQYADLVK